MVDLGINVDALPLAPPRYSLLSSVDVSTPSDPHWPDGIHFLPETCDEPANPYWWACFGEGGANPGFTKDLPDPETPVAYRPYDIWTGFKCSAMSASGVEWEARANRALEAVQSKLIERELWAGDKVEALAHFGNDYLTNSPTPLNAGANTPYVTALAELEQALASCNPGQVGVIHAQPRTVTLWIQNGLVSPEANGRRLRTQLGTIVVAGAGYPGSGTGLGLPGGGTVASSWAYGTGMVRVFLGPIVRLKSDSSNPPSGHGLDTAEVDRSVNTVNVRVERSVAAFWDECCQVGVRVNHTSAL